MSKWLRDWKLVSLSAYNEDFRWPVIIACLLFLGLLYLTRVPAAALLHWLLIDPVLVKIPENDWLADLVFIGFLLLAFIFFVGKLRKHLIPTPSSVAVVVTIVLAYILLRTFEPIGCFNHFTFCWLQNRTYATAFLLSIIPILFTYKRYYHPLTIPKSGLSFIEDTSDTKQYEDIYSRQGFAETLFNHITATTTNFAFVIGIVGDWGSGKSDLQTRLRLRLGDNSDTLVVEFNAWRVNKPDVLIEAFFKAISKVLQPFNHSIAGKIREYSKKILQPSKETPLRFLDTLIGEWLDDDDLQTQYVAINNAIKSTGKRVVVFIDDTDRLSSKEVMEVLRLVRNTANFANTFFVVGIDYSYIRQILAQSREYANEEEYLKKAFQFTITLPAFDKKIFLAAIKAELLTGNLTEAQKEMLTQGLDSLSNHGKDPSAPMNEGAHQFGFIETLLDNMRDVKRFVNSFKVIYNLVKDDCEIRDLIVLELIRNKNIEVYNKIRSRELIEYSIDTFKYTVNDEKWKSLHSKEGKAWSAGTVADLGTALEYLFTEDNKKNWRSVVDPGNFYIYFSYQLFNQIPLALFNQALQGSVTQILTQFDKWIQEGKGGDLAKAAAALEVFSDAATLAKTIVAFASVQSDHPQWLLNANHLFFTKREFNLNRYFHNDKKEYGEFIRSFMSDNQTDYYIRARLAYNFLYAFVVGQDDHLILSKKEWQRIVYRLFSQFLDQGPTDFEKVWRFYNLNDYKRENNYIILYPPAGRRLKLYILNTNSALEAFTSKMVEPARNSNKGYYMIYPEVIEAIFGRVAPFLELLERTAFSDPVSDKARKAILIHIVTYIENRRPFLLAEPDRPDKA